MCRWSLPASQAGATASASALRRLDEYQLPPVQHLRDRAGLLDLRVRVANRVMQGLDVDARDLHAGVFPRFPFLPTPRPRADMMVTEPSRGRSVVVAQEPSKLLGRVRFPSPASDDDIRGVAQSGSAPGWGPGGRRFKSCLPDHAEAPETRGFCRF